MTKVIHKYTYHPPTSHVHNIKASLSRLHHQGQKQKNIRRVQGQRKLGLPPGVKINAKEACNEKLEDFEPNEKLSYILSVLATPGDSSNNSTPRVQAHKSFWAPWEVLCALSASPRAAVAH